jgi:hypothetical protein
MSELGSAGELALASPGRSLYDSSGAASAT